MKKRFKKYSVTTLIIAASLIAGVALGFINYLFNPAVSESDAASLPVIQSFSGKYTWYNTYGILNVNFYATAPGTVIKCVPSSSPVWSYWSGGWWQGSGAVGFSVSNVAPKNTYYNLTLKCSTSAGSTSKTIKVTTAVSTGGGCLVADTKVAMADGSEKNIQDVRVGDMVKSSDGAAAVTKTFVHEVNEEAIWLINGSLAATANHPVFADGKWVRADELKVGDKLYGGAVVSTLEKTERSEPVYNLEVDGSHDYFANGILVHNKIMQ